VQIPQSILHFPDRSRGGRRGRGKNKLRKKKIGRRARFPPPCFLFFLEDGRGERGKKKKEQVGGYP